MKLFFVNCLTALLVFSMGVANQRKTPEPEPVVVTVSAEAVPVSVTSASVTVIDSKAIEESGVETLPDLLRTLPGLDLVQTGSRGGRTTISVRGAEENFTLVMVDGVPLNDISGILGGAVDLSSISLASVEKIELVRGPMSSIFGSEALGGVLNIITRKGKGKPVVSAGGQIGSFKTAEVGFGLSGAHKEFDYSLGASYFDISEQVESDEYSLGTFSGKAGYAIGDRTALGFVFRFADRSSSGFPENGGGPLYSVLRDPQLIDSVDTVLAVEVNHQVSSSWLVSLDLDSFSRNQDIFTPAILDGMPPSIRSIPSREGRTEFDRRRLAITSSWRMTPFLRGNLSGKVICEEGTDESILAGFIPSSYNASRITSAASGELLFSKDRLSASLGLRLDKSEDYDSEISPRLGVRYEAHPGLWLKANFGKGFKLPSFFAVSDPNVGNPDLKPEKSQGLDVGLEKQFRSGQLGLSVTYFHNSFRDLIDFSPEEFLLVNRSRTNTQGLETEFRWQMNSEFRLSAHVRYMDLEIVGSEEELRNRPKWRGGYELSWRPSSRLLLNVGTIRVGERFDFQLPVPYLNQVEGYSATHLIFRYHMRSGVEAFTRIDNLFDSDYQEFIGFPNPGVYARLGIRFSWSQ